VTPVEPFKVGDQVCYQNGELIGAVVQIQSDDLNHQLIKVELGNGECDSFGPDELRHA
jgi:hypothetical protein